MDRAKIADAVIAAETGEESDGGIDHALTLPRETGPETTSIMRRLS